MFDFGNELCREGWLWFSPGRNKRSPLSNVLSRNEVDRDYPYNRKLFKRIAHGWYQINPGLSFAHPDQWGVSQALWRSRANTELPTPVAEEARRRQAGSRANPEAPPPRWGTPEAKTAAREELRRRIEAQRNADKIGKR